MSSVEDVTRALAAAQSAAERTLNFSALLASEAGDPRLIIVGGSAIEVYTDSAYVSGDIDLVGDRTKILRVLRSWGFTGAGRILSHEAWKLLVEVPSREYNGSWARTEKVRTPYGDVRLAAAEDLIVKRLYTAHQSNRRDDFEQAALVARAREGKLDWDYVQEYAEREGIGELVPRLRHALERPGPPSTEPTS